MTREERRKRERIARKAKKAGFAIVDSVSENGKADFSTVPTQTLCSSIFLLIQELKRRGYPLYDFDHKEKSIQQIQIIGEKIYFLAAEEGEDEKQGRSGSDIQAD